MQIETVEQFCVFEPEESASPLQSDSTPEARVFEGASSKARPAVPPSEERAKKEREFMLAGEAMFDASGAEYL